MKVLLLRTDNMLSDELCEMIDGIQAIPYVADSREEALSILSAASIDAVIFTLRTFADLEFLHFLNISYPQITVYLTMEGRIRDIVSILKQGQYQVVPSPCSLWEVKRSLEVNHGAPPMKIY